jgi:2-(1,2-epoxy-1,2-dihydrophenyl)acetyl-CoA isomerase
VSEGLRVEVAQGVARITFDRPETRNALSPDVLEALADTLRRVEDDAAVRCILITGAGDHFVGGGDVKSFGPTLELSPLERKHVFERRLSATGGLYATLQRMGKPMVARVRGAVAGAGISLVLACDFAVGAENSFFVFAHRALGLPPDGALSYFLPRIVGWRRAKQLVLLGARLNSQEALDIGLLTSRVPDIGLDEACEKIIASLVEAPSAGARLAKALFDVSLHNGIAEQLRLEAAAVAECAATADFEEGVRAFLEKRKPRFTGA